VPAQPGKLRQVRCLQGGDNIFYSPNFV